MTCLLASCGGGGDENSPPQVESEQVHFVTCNAGNKCATSITALKLGTQLYDVQLTLNFTSETPDPSRVQASWGDAELTRALIDAIDSSLLANGIEGFYVSGASFSTGFELPYAGSYQTGLWTISGVRYAGDFSNHQVATYPYYDIGMQRHTFDGIVVARVIRRAP
jgi:hypothetical protein